MTPTRETFGNIPFSSQLAFYALAALAARHGIGVAEPVSLSVESFGTGRISDERIVELIRSHFDLRPAGIIKDLDLIRPIYRQTAAYGHFGRNDLDLPWERLDKVDALKADAGIA